MAINFSQGFNITAQEPVDARLILSKEEMLNVKKARMPEKYFCLCKDDGKIYVYDSSLEPSTETGRFKEHDIELQSKVQDALDAVEELNQKLIDEYVSKAELPNAISSELPAALQKAMEDQPEQMQAAVAEALPGALADALANQADPESGLVVDENGNIKVSLNEEHLEIIDNQINLALELIQAIDGN